MKFANVALTGLVVITASSLISQIHAFTPQSRGLSHVGISQSRQQHKHMSVSPMEETENASDRTKIENELASGRILEDGPVIDFGSIKDTTSTAERALAEARKEYISAIASGGKGAVKLGFAGDGDTRLMGINDDVVKEVGHEVGAFCNDNTKIQNCAAYLRATAPKGLFEEHADAPLMSENEMKAIDTSGLTALLEEAYVESGLVTEAFAKTFYLGTQLLPEPAQRAVWAIYVWCRRTDEIVDAPREPEDVNMLTDLSAWELRLENVFRYGIVEDVLDLALLDCKIKYPKLPIDPFVDMVRGMLMDIPDLGQDRYETFEELHLYCYRVAGTVGLMVMPVFGCAQGYTEAIAKEPALSLGVAFQITNILRDVGEDAVTRGRIYLPRDDMEKFGVTEEQIIAQRLDDNYKAMMKFQIERARMYYDRALRGVPMLSPESRLPVQSSLDCYGKILDKIEENEYDTLTKRAYVSKWEKLATIPFSWYRTLDISKVLPIPGDKN